MQKRTILSVMAVLLSLSVTAPAIDRGAGMIDTISMEWMRYDAGEGLGVSLWGESATAMKEEQWAVLFGGSLGTISPDIGNGIDYWEIGLGMKYYVFEDTSLALVGLYREVDIVNTDVLTTELTLKHRFVPADETVSPFVRAGIATRTVGSTPEPGVNDEFTEMVLSVGLGIDFMMTDDFAIVFDSTWYITEEIDGDQTPDWWLGRVGMQYYWE